MKNGFKRLIREKTYRTKFDLLVDTTSKQKAQPKEIANSGYKHFCYTILAKGDLRVVVNTTYMLNSGSRASYDNDNTGTLDRTFNTYFNSNS
jgi:hypothetical protein